MSVQSGGTEGVRMEMGIVIVEAVHGNIVEETTDAIVNSTNDIMDFNGQVSKALLAKGGNKILADCQAKGNIGGEGVFAASAEGTNLECKYVIHLNINKPAGLLVKYCFSEADRLKLRSISVPLLGTGNHGADADRIIPGLVSGVREFISSVTPLHLRLIRFVVFQPHLMSIFKSAMMVSFGRPAVQGIEAPLGIDVSHRLPESAMPGSTSACEPFSFEVASATLTDNRMNELKQYAALHGVHVTFDRSMGRVTLYNTDPIVRNAVHLYIENTSDELQAYAALQRKVQWQFWKDREEWFNYSPSLNYKIEMAQRAGKQSVTYASGIGTFVVDFQKKRDYLENNEEMCCANIRRLDKETVRP